MNETEAALAAALGPDLPTGLAALDAAKLSWLCETIHEQTQVQLVALDESAETVLQNLPALLRGPARVFIGGTR